MVNGVMTTSKGKYIMKADKVAHSHDSKCDKKGRIYYVEAHVGKKINIKFYAARTEASDAFLGEGSFDVPDLFETEKGEFVLPLGGFKYAEIKYKCLRSYYYPGYSPKMPRPKFSKPSVPSGFPPASFPAPVKK